MTEPLVLLDSGTSSPLSTDAPALLVEEVARRAYAKWTTRCQSWKAPQLQDWLEAEAELVLEKAVIGRLTKAKEQSASQFAHQWDAERRLIAVHAVSSILTVAETITDAIPKLVRAIGECFDWDAGAGWILDRDANLLRCVGFWHQVQFEVPSFERDTLLRTFSQGIGMPGRVWASQSFVWIPDVSADSNFLRSPVAAKEGLRGAIAFPVHNGIELLGVLEFLSREIREPDQNLIEMMTTIGNHISQFIERRTAEQRLLRQEHERRIGREIQQGLLPQKMPLLSGFEISGRSLAPNIVGGDCFDFIPLPETGTGTNCLCILVADASGHGIGAALLTVQTCAYLRGVALTVSDVGLLLDLTNQCLSNDPTSCHFVTAFLMKIDRSTRSLGYTSAGHLPGYVLNPQGHIRAILASTGLPLGIDPAIKYPTSTVSLEPGDLILLITDGITEATSPEGELFGMERTLSLVRQHQQQTPDEILTALLAGVDDYSNHNCLDDLTAVIIKVE